MRQKAIKQHKNKRYRYENMFVSEMFGFQKK